MNDLAGHVEVGARLADGRLAGVSVVACRPTLAPLLVGRRPQEALELLGRVFGICAQAHAAAASCALAAARGEAIAPRVDPSVAMEALRELLLSACTGACRPLLPALLRTKAAGGQLPAALAAGLAGGDLQPWLAVRSLAGLQSLAREGDTLLAREAGMRLAAAEPVACRSALLPALDAAGSLAGLPRLDTGTCRRPSWRDQPAETGALALLHGHPLLQELGDRPLLQRWCARLLLLWQLAGCTGAVQPAASLGTASGMPVGECVGRGAALTARGLLLHEIRLEGQRVSSWEILAPTEWNCHPSGPLPGWLEGLPAADEAAARSAVDACAAALDPCVPVRVVLR